MWLRDCALKLVDFKIGECLWFEEKLTVSRMVWQKKWLWMARLGLRSRPSPYVWRLSGSFFPVSRPVVVFPPSSEAFV